MTSPSISIIALSIPILEERPPAKRRDRILSPQFIQTRHRVLNFLQQVQSSVYQDLPIPPSSGLLEPTHQLGNIPRI
ncbi:uncharacterized protein METZ01_LOCUS439675, partial [marine metagenome]